MFLNLESSLARCLRMVGASFSSLIKLARCLRPGARWNCLNSGRGNLCTGEVLCYYCPKGLLCRAAPKIDVCASVRAVRPSVRPCHPKIKKIWDFPNNLIQRDASDLVTINRVLALVTPSSATNSGSVRDVNLCIWSESLFWNLSTQKALRATLPCWCYLVQRCYSKTNVGWLLTHDTRVQ